jgi:TRAP-type C4-dicarboxylate transport system substrate-binding protein
MIRALLTFAVIAAHVASAEPVVLKLGSLAPRESPWGAVLRVWQKAVKDKTKGEVTIEIFWNATQGDEAAQMSKVKTGQLDGAIVSAVGLSMVDPDVNVLQVPGLYPDWATLDRVRVALAPRFEKSFHEAGMVLIGWGDIGLDRFISQGYGAKKPDDLKGKRGWVWREDPLLPPVFQLTGTVVVPTALPEVMPELSTGNVNVLVVSALAAEQLQWASRLDHISRAVVAPNIGGIVITKAGLERLPAASRDVVVDTGRLAAKALTDRIRAEDAKAFERLQKRMTVVEPSAEDLAAWKKLFAAARVQLGKGTFSPKLLEEVEQLAK